MLDYVKSAFHFTIKAVLSIVHVNRKKINGLILKSFLKTHVEGLGRSYFCPQAEEGENKESHDENVAETRRTHWPQIQRRKTNTAKIVIN